MLSASELRKQARTNLAEKWSQVVVITLIYMAVSFAISLASNFIPFIGIAFIIITIPFEYGLIYSFIKVYRNEEFSYGDLFTSAFDNFKKVWCVVGNQLLKLIVPIILFVVSIIIMVVGIVLVAVASNLADSSSFLTILSIIFLILGYVGYIASLIFLLVKSLLYILSYYILYDNPNMTAKQVIEESERIMNGQRGKYFCLELSFIGWILLSFITFGVGLLFLIPYMQMSVIAFYEDRIGKSNQLEVQNTNVQ